MKRLTLAAALLLAAAACGGSDPETAPVEPVATSTPAATATATASPALEAAMVTERNGLQDPHPVKWQTATPGEDDMSVTVTWWSSPEECVGLDGTEVVYGGSSIALDIIEGSVRRTEPCPNSRVLKSTIIQLVQPLQGRDIRPLSVI